MGNLDFKAGLCKGELSLVTALGDRTITVKLLAPPNQAQDEFMLFHIIFNFQPTGMPDKISRHQFSVCFRIHLSKNSRLGCFSSAS